MQHAGHNPKKHTNIHTHYILINYSAYFSPCSYVFCAQWNGALIEILELQGHGSDLCHVADVCNGGCDGQRRHEQGQVPELNDLQDGDRGRK